MRINNNPIFESKKARQRLQLRRELKKLHFFNEQVKRPEEKFFTVDGLSCYEIFAIEYVNSIGFKWGVRGHNGYKLSAPARRLIKTLTQMKLYPIEKEIVDYINVRKRLSC